MGAKRNACEAGFTLLETIVALAVFMIVLAIAITTINRLMLFAGVADKNMLVATEYQHAMLQMKNDLYCSSKSSKDKGAPKPADGELRFKICIGFDPEAERPTIYPDYKVCYWLDTSRNLLIRRFRDDNDVLLEDAPVHFPGPPEQVLCQYCTAASFTIPDPNIAMVVVKLTLSIGEEGTEGYAVYPLPEEDESFLY